MGQRLWKNGKDGLEEWYSPEDYWSVIFENIVSKILAGIIIGIGIILFAIFK